jgi:ketosteroid isomerase-like protein
MRRVFFRMIVLGFVLAIALAALHQVLAADDRSAAAEADRALIAAAQRGDKQALAALLDAEFTWTDADGVAHTRAASLDKFGDVGATDVQTHFYGRVFTVRGAHDKVRFLRIWVKRNDRWQAFVLLETPVAPRSGPASVEAAAGQGDCDNPCRTVPYVPKTEMDKAILAAWQATKMIEWKPDAEAWARYIADEFMIINNTTIRTRPERIAIAKKQQDAGIGAPGDPIIRMEIHDFGDNAAVMISEHLPYRGGKPYRNVRVWVLRDGRWQLAISQQSTIQAAQPLPAVAAKK